MQYAPSKHDVAGENSRTVLPCYNTGQKKHCIELTHTHDRTNKSRTKDLKIKPNHTKRGMKFA